MEGIMKISLGIIILVLVINSGGQVLAKKSNNNKFDLSAIENRKIAVKSDRLWNQGIIPFVIKKALAWELSGLIIRAMKFWESKTCVKFIDYNSDQHPNYLLFSKSNSCNSQLGKYREGKNIVHISKKCGYNNIVREVGHAMGFNFEHEPEYEKLKNKTDGNLQNNGTSGISEREQTSDMVYQCLKCGRTMQEPTGDFGTLIISNNSVIEGKGTEICEWRITGARSDKIVLNIRSLNIYKTPNCTTDYIEVRDGYWSGSPLLGRFCGNESILPIKSQSDRMLVTYVKTSDKKDYYGFTASYYKTCGGDIQINNNIAFLESPNYPFSYQPNSQCTWNVSYPQNKTLRIINYYFLMDQSSGCDNNFVEIRDGFDFKSSLIGRYCGSHMSTKTNATGGNIQIKFYSETPNEKSGFSILVRANDNNNKTVNIEIETPVTDSASHQAFNLGFIFFVSLLSLYSFIN